MLVRDMLDPLVEGGVGGGCCKSPMEDSGRRSNRTDGAAEPGMVVLESANRQEERIRKLLPGTTCHF